MAVPRKRKTKAEMDKEWHLDKKVPIALILVLLVQGAVALSWANYMSADVQQLKTDVAEIKADSREQRLDLRNMLAALARLEALKTKETHK